ncbi:integrin alpha [Nannocystis radixulma]|uniref:FG-GAP repeat protein n=1 Tax=Nannocystis radixulma TaxID=2995305 RepID=A0ABT5AYE9_9BACT|nr:hypothetical protein [Nannocystis radixulma]MDC0666874.1 hypothetical protein [Nannocystis radixulma]
MHRIIRGVPTITLIACLVPALAHARGPDFDHDGYEDLAIGSPYEKIGTTITNAGLVNVLYGSSAGLDDPATRMTSIWQDQTDIADSSQNGDLFGYSMAWGDFNGDCFDDLVVGVPIQTVDGVEDAGALHVFFGSSSGLRADNDYVLTGASAGIPGDPLVFGFNLVSGDFNNDNRDDIAVQYRENNEQIMIIYGSSAGLSGTAGPGAHVFNSTANHQSFGGALATGDFNCDGYEDLAIGDSVYKIGTDEVGRVDIIYGSSTGLSTSAGPGAEYLLNYAGPTHGDHFGGSLAVGNFNGDTTNGNACQDLAVGVSQVSIGTGIGAVAVFYGTSASGIQASFPADQYITQDWGSILDSGEWPDDSFGWTVAAMYADNDGYTDLVVGNKGEDAGRGVVHVIRGSASGLTDVNNRMWSQATTDVPGSPVDGDLFGHGLACGDFDGAGAEDLAIYVPHEFNPGVNYPNEGVVQVLYLSNTSTPTISAGEQWEQGDIDTRLTEPEDQFGSVMAAPRPVEWRPPLDCIM